MMKKRQMQYYHRFMAILFDHPFGWVGETGRDISRSSLVYFNSVLGKHCKEYMIQTEEQRIYIDIFSSFRDDMAQNYFSAIGDYILDDYWEKWLWENRREIKAEFIEQEKALFYVAAGKWLRSICLSEWPKIRSHNLADYDSQSVLHVTPYGIVAIKMFLACTFAVKSIVPYADFDRPTEELIESLNTGIYAL